jgi:hypothetical protein
MNLPWLEKIEDEEKEALIYSSISAIEYEMRGILSIAAFGPHTNNATVEIFVLTRSKVIVLNEKLEVLRSFNISTMNSFHSPLMINCVCSKDSSLFVCRGDCQMNIDYVKILLQDSPTTIVVFDRFGNQLNKFTFPVPLVCFATKNNELFAWTEAHCNIIQL